MVNSIAVGIVFKLLRGRRVTAKELSLDYEVSIRTIYRYLDIIGASGIPLISFSGKNGGVELDKNFKIDDNFLTLQEVKYLLNLLKKQEKTSQNSILIEKFNKIYQIV